LKPGDPDLRGNAPQSSRWTFTKLRFLKNVADQLSAMDTRKKTRV
jgi:hypothetical protein